MTTGKCTITLPPPPDSNGYEFVDLGLPSKTLWATMNVGANKPSDFGKYFQWGDTVGYAYEQVGKDKQFTETTNKWYTNGHYTKYTSNGETIDLEDDAARANMGGDWHMPTPTQIQELINETTSTWTPQDGVDGRLFTSKKDNSKSIFIPAAGNASVGSVNYSGRAGYVWSSLVGINGNRYGQSLFFNSKKSEIDSQYSNRANGFSVRGVIDTIS